MLFEIGIRCRKMLIFGAIYRVLGSCRKINMNIKKFLVLDQKNAVKDSLPFNTGAVQGRFYCIGNCFVNCHR